MKKTLAVLAALTLALAVPAMADAGLQQPKETRFFAAYEGNGVVEIDFRGDVRYRDLTVTAADLFGNPQTVTVLEMDDDDLTFRIEDAKEDMVYTFTAGGVKFGVAGEFETLTGEITVPAAGHTVIQSIEKDDGNLEIELMGPVAYENVSVTLTGPDGAAVEADIVEREGDGIEIRVRGLVSGEEYTVTVNGVGLRGSGVYGSVSRSFIAR